jgi:type I restriction enzyme, S subunit
MVTSDAARVTNRESDTAEPYILNGYKKTEVGMIPSDWIVRRVSDVCRLTNGRGFKPFEWRKRGLPIIRIQNLNGSDDFNYFQGSYDRKLEIHPDQLLFAWSGNRGTSFGPYIWNGPFGLLNYHTWKIDADRHQVATDFFFHALKGLTEYIESWAHGASALVHVQKWQMEKFQLALPPAKDEQQAIAEALSDADALIESLDKLIAKKRDVKQGAMQELLTGKKRLPGFDDKWEEKRLGDIAEIRDGTHQTPRYVESGIPFFSVENVTNGDFTNTKFISETEHRFLTKSFKIEKGDILMTRIGSIGDCKLVDWDVDASFYVSLALLKIRKGYSPAFISHYSDSVFFKTEVELNSLQSAIPKKINLGPISEIRIRIPADLNEQTAIASILSDMDAEIAALERKLSKATKIKRGMMHELLTGRIRLV